MKIKWNKSTGYELEIQNKQNRKYNDNEMQIVHDKTGYNDNYYYVFSICTELEIYYCQAQFQLAITSCS